VLDVAERVEREAIQYVFELSRLFPDFAKDQVTILLEEEQNHLQMVLDRKKEAEIGYILL
jgi:rubrerythrin